MVIVEDAPLIDSHDRCLRRTYWNSWNTQEHQRYLTCNRTANTEGVLIIGGHLLVAVGVTHLNFLM